MKLRHFKTRDFKTREPARDQWKKFINTDHQNTQNTAVCHASWKRRQLIVISHLSEKCGNRKNIILRPQKKTLGNYKTFSSRYKTLLLFSPDERNKIPVSSTTPKEDIFIKENRCLSRTTKLKDDGGFGGSGCWMVQESRILPWTVITELAATGAAACAAKLRGKVLGGDLLQEFCLIAPAQNIDFLDLNSENSQPQTGRALLWRRGQLR